MDHLEVKLDLVNNLKEDQRSLKQSEPDEEETEQDLLESTLKADQEDESSSQQQQLDDTNKTESQIEYETIKQIEAQIERNRILKKLLLNKLEELRQIEDTSL